MPVSTTLIMYYLNENTLFPCGRNFTLIA